MRAALYARVSSDRQEQEQTIQSQLAELRVRLCEDAVVSYLGITDEGYGRDNLVRPGLDRLRDLIAQGDVSRVYVQCPDRLAAGAKLVMLYEEFRQHGAEVVFLKGSVEDTPEGKLLLHMQGAMGEYERTKIAERTRRGKLYWAMHGVMVGGHAPYGYRFVRRTEGARARLEMDEIEAVVVREMYRLVRDEHISTRGLAHLLTERGVPTASGAAQWQPTARESYTGGTPFTKARFYTSGTSRSLPHIIGAQTTLTADAATPDGTPGPRRTGSPSLCLP